VIDGYLIPVYDESVTYNASEGAAINSGQLLPLQVVPQVLVGSLRTPFPTPRDLPAATDEQKTLSVAFNNATQQDFSYRSTMNNFELNGRFTPRGDPDRLVLHPDGRWQRQCQPGTYMSYLYGIRYMQVDETFTFHSVGQGQFGEDVTQSAQNAVGDYDIVAHNDMLGLQVGADMTFRHCRWTVGPRVEGRNLHQLRQSDQHDQCERPQWVVSPRLRSAAGGQPLRSGLRWRDRSSGHVQVPAQSDGPRGLRSHVDYGRRPGPRKLQLIAEPVDRINVNGTIFSQCLSLGLEWMW